MALVRSDSPAPGVERLTLARPGMHNALVPELLDDLVARFDAHDVWWAPINSIFDVIADPQAQANGAFIDMTPHEGEDSYRAVNGPIDFGGYAFRPGRVPRLGEHTAEVLAELDGTAR